MRKFLKDINFYILLIQFIRPIINSFSAHFSVGDWVSILGLLKAFLANHYKAVSPVEV